MIHYGLFGMSFQPEGITFTPTLPDQWGPATLDGLRYRNMTLTLRLSGAGTRLQLVRLDGRTIEKGFLPADLTGHHELELKLGR
jgi:trehalose/maltose hydrolase-like predicted phosphorylase